MRKLILAGWIGVLLTTGTASAQQAGAQEPWANKLFGGITSKDFGTVAKGSQLKYSFKMTNIYKVPLEITNVRVMCSCVTFTKTAQVLQPNETAEISINMDARRFDGPKSVNLFVTVGPQYISTAMLTVTATTRQNVVLNPGEIDFGVVQRGHAPTHFIDVQHSGGANWRLLEIVKNINAPFELRAEDLKGLGAGRTGYRIFATLKADAEPGQFKQEILLKTNDAAGQVLTFNILGNIQAPLSASPPSVNVNSLKPGGVIEQKVSILGSQPFKILRIDGQGQGITATFAPDRLATLHIIVVRCQPDQAGDVRRNLIVVSSLDNQSVQVPVETHGEK